MTAVSMYLGAHMIRAAGVEAEAIAATAAASAAPLAPALALTFFPDNPVTLPRPPVAASTSASAEP